MYSKLNYVYCWCISHADWLPDVTKENVYWIFFTLDILKYTKNSRLQIENRQILQTIEFELNKIFFDAQ